MKLTMAQAINTALRDAMTADDSVVVFGEDVGPLGGVFRVTDGLTRDFGDTRCFDTPLAESGIVGMAVGMAMNGMRHPKLATWSASSVDFTTHAAAEPSMKPSVTPAAAELLIRPRRPGLASSVV